MSTFLSLIFYSHTYLFPPNSVQPSLCGSRIPWAASMGVMRSIGTAEHIVSSSVPDIPLPTGNAATYVLENAKRWPTKIALVSYLLNCLPFYVVLLLHLFIFIFSSFFFIFFYFFIYFLFFFFCLFFIFVSFPFLFLLLPFFFFSFFFISSSSFLIFFFLLH